MPKLNRCAIAIFTILSAISSPTLLANINEPSGEAADIISQVADSHAIKYYNAADWQAEDNALPSLAELRDLVINQQNAFWLISVRSVMLKVKQRCKPNSERLMGWFC